jgi:tRNA1(Val) A37 N6-methylase TrmN6
MEIGSLCTGRNLNLTRIQFIHPYHHRDANLVLVEAVKGSKAGLRVHPPLVVYESDGNYTKEILKIYSDDPTGSD